MQNFVKIESSLNGEITFLFISLHIYLPGRLVQSVTCLATYKCLTADPVVAFDPNPVPYFRGD